MYNKDKIKRKNINY